jgi:hypothetical protein
LQDLDYKLSRFVATHFEREMCLEKLAVAKEKGTVDEKIDCAMFRSLHAHRDSLKLLNINKTEDLLLPKPKENTFKQSKSMKLNRGPGFKVHDENTLIGAF